jgi:hypothetical protein
MINAQISRDGAYFVGARQTVMTVGPLETRTTVEVEIYERYRDVLTFLTKGIAILNPLDKFNVRIGLHKAMASALNGLPIEVVEKKKFHDLMDEWADGQDQKG